MRKRSRWDALPIGLRAMVWATCALLASSSALADAPRPGALESDPAPATPQSRELDPDTAAAADSEPDESFASRFSFRGFGTLGLVYASVDDADFVGSIFQPNGAGHNRPVDFGVDSRIAGQMDVRITEDLTAVVQVMSQHGYDNRYWPELEWANLKYQITPDFSIRLGRTAAGYFLVSESRLIGYANPWVRPPLELYSIGSVTHRDGIDGSYRYRVRGFTNTLALGYGLTSEELPKGKDGGRVDAKHFFEVSHRTERGPFTFRIGWAYSQLDLRSPSLDAFFDAFTDLGEGLGTIPGLELQAAQALRVVDRYEMDGTPFSLFSLGAIYDSGPWLLMAELGRTNGSAFLPDSTAWYVTGARRFGAWTPYLTFAEVKADHRYDRGIATAGLPPFLSGPIGQFNDGLDLVLTLFGPSQRTASAGLRWDFRRNMALKLQYERVDLRSGSAGRLANLQPEFEPGGHFHAVSLAIDFVF